MNETQEMVLKHLGEEAFYEFQLKFGGINIYIGRPDKEAVWYYYKEKEMKERDIAMKLRVSEAFVYNCLKKKKKEKFNKNHNTLFDEQAD